MDSDIAPYETALDEKPIPFFPQSVDLIDSDGIDEVYLGNPSKRSMELLKGPACAFHRFVWENSDYSNLPLEQVEDPEFFEKRKDDLAIKKAGMTLDLCVNRAVAISSMIDQSTYEFKDFEDQTKHLVCFGRSYQFYQEVSGDFRINGDVIEIDNGQLFAEPAFASLKGIADVIHYSYPMENFEDFFIYPLFAYEKSLSIFDQNPMYTYERSNWNVFNELFAENFRDEILTIEDCKKIKVSGGLLSNLHIYTNPMSSKPQAHFGFSATLLY